MKLILLLGIALCAYAADVEKPTEKRQTQEGLLPTRFIYRVPRKQNQAAPVEEPQQDEDREAPSHAEPDQYRRGQVFSLNAQELLELQPERKAPLTSNQLLQQLYNNPQPEHKENLQQFYYLDPQVARQVSLQPSHAVIARPSYSSNGGEASVGAALSVSDTGASPSSSLNQEILALLNQASVRQEQPRKQTYTQPFQSQQATTIQSVAPHYQQVEKHVPKANKKSSKIRAKVYIPQPSSQPAPQQYLIETTNVQQQAPQPQHQIQAQPQHQIQAQPQYHSSPQPQRHPQVLRYIPFQQSSQLQQQIYERPESQGLKIVEAPNLQPVPQQRAQLDYRYVPQYIPEAAPKQYKLAEAPKPQPIKQELHAQSSNDQRPVTYLKRYPENEKLRSVKIYDPILSEGFQLQAAQGGGDQYLLRPLYRTNDPRGRYDLSPLSSKPEPQGPTESAKPHSTIYVSKNLAPRKLSRPQTSLRDHNTNQDEAQEQQLRQRQPSNVEQIHIEQHGQNIDDQRAHLPPPKNNKAYTPEEFAALVAAGYSVTPVPISSVNLDIAQSRSDVVTSHPALAPQPNHRPINRRPLYLPLSGDDAP